MRRCVSVVAVLLAVMVGSVFAEARQAAVSGSSAAAEVERVERDLEDLGAEHQCSTLPPHL